MTSTSATTRRPLGRLLLAMLMAFALLAAACSDEGDSSAEPADDETTETDSTDDEATADDESDDVSEDESSDDASEDDASDDEMSDEMSDDGFEGDASSDYCSLAAEQNVIDSEFPFFSASPAEIEAYFRDNRDALAEAVDSAPAEIQDDLRTVLRAFDEDFFRVLADADWNFLDAAEELEAIGEDPELTAAQERLEAYDAEVCGIGGLGDASGDDGSSDAEDFFNSPEGLEALLDSEFGRQAIIEGITQSGEIDATQAECLIDNLDFALLASLSSGAPDQAVLGEMLSAFDTCGISPDQFS